MKGFKDYLEFSQLTPEQVDHLGHFIHSEYLSNDEVSYDEENEYELDDVLDMCAELDEMGVPFDINGIFDDV